MAYSFVSNVSAAVGQHMVKNGTVVYVCASNAIRCVDVSNPNVPVQRSSIALGGGGTVVQNIGTDVYVSDQVDNLLRKYSFADPDAPTATATVSSTDGPAGMLVEGGNAYVSHVNNFVLRIIDCAAMTVTASTGGNTDYWNNTSVAYLRSGYLHTPSNNDAGGGGGIGVYSSVTDVDPIASVAAAANLKLSGTAHRSCLVGSGDHLLVLNLTGGSYRLSLVDISTPLTPTKISDPITLGGLIRHMSISGSTVLVPSRTENLVTIVDWSTITAPVVSETFSVTAGTSPEAALLDGNYIYVVGANGFSVYSSSGWQVGSVAIG